MVLGADAVNAVRAVLASVDDNPVTQSEVCLELLRYTLRVDPGKTQPILASVQFLHVVLIFWKRKD